MASKASEFRDSAFKEAEYIFELANLAISDPLKASAFKSRYDDVAKIRNEFREAHVAFTLEIQNMDPKESKKLTKAHSDMERKFQDIITEIKTIHFDLTKDSETSAITTNTYSRTNNNNVKLPKLSIPIFTGKLIEWSHFSDLFISLVHDNASLSEIEKYEYLKLSLKGEALSLIKHLPVNSASYTSAWKIIHDRYSVKRTIVEFHVKQILSTPVCSSRSYGNLNKLVNVLRENIAALKVLNLPVKEWSFLLLTIVKDKLDSHTRSRYEDLVKNCPPQMLPEFEELFKFLDSELSMLQAMESSSLGSPKHKTFKKGNDRFRTGDKANLFTKVEKTPSKRSTNHMIEKPTTGCALCKANHPLTQCSQFLNKTPFERFNFIRHIGHCINCLTAHHDRPCLKRKTCSICHREHNDLLHFAKKVTPTMSQPTLKKSEVLPSDSSKQSLQTIVHNSTGDKFTVILPTAIAFVKDSFNRFVPVRCLLDTGSQSSYITRDCATRLQLKCKPFMIEVFGLGKTPLPDVKQFVHCNIASSETPTRHLTTTALVVNEISHHMPQAPVSTASLAHLRGLKLADPSWHMPAKVDMLLGCELTPLVILPGKRTGKRNSPVAIRSIFGWVLMGKASNASPISRTAIREMCGFTTAPILDEQPLIDAIKGFWEIENVHNEILKPNKQDQLCEEIFIKEHIRNESGRYSVALPFVEFPPALGNSYNVALKCYKSLRARLNRSPLVKQQYIEFMDDYLQSGHMTRAPDASTSDGYFIPHHCVQKPDNVTTKLRVVFNASQPTSNQVSLNDVLLVGPPLQTDIVAILTGFRLYKVALVADMRQMYRQINVLPKHHKYQKILWDFDLSPEPEIFELTTVTYGFKSSSFEALRTVKQLVYDEGDQFPNAAKVVPKDMYMDDIISGADSVSDAVSLQRELTGLFSKGGFSLHKWGSSDVSVLKTVPELLQVQQMGTFQSESDVAIKILGMKWDSMSDSFFYEVKSSSEQWCKRKILSTIARLFDPLGFLAPAIMVAKLIMQMLWDSEVGWDDPLPTHILDQWTKFHDQLYQLALIRVNRFIPNLDRKVNLYCFADASEKGYAAVIYAKHPEHGLPSLLVAKTRVAPLKRISLPRLELCAALLTARLVHSIKIALGDSIEEIYAFSDSMVTLEWLRAPSYKWATFVANRVAEIQSVLPYESWFHVKSKDNAADSASRGLLPSQLINHPLWWAGPKWLSSSPRLWPRSSGEASREDVVKEKASKDIQGLCFLTNNNFNVIENFSSLRKLLRVFARIIRLADKIRCRAVVHSDQFSCQELDSALTALLRIEQSRHFAVEIKAVKERKGLPRNFKKLNPFIDDKGLLRVGGRLSMAPLVYDQRHPILLPGTSHLTELLIWHYHIKHCHAGPQALQGIMFQKYWILSARAILRRILHRCIVCFRDDPPSYAPLMGNLPLNRVSPAKPFLKVGVDYGGPFKVTSFRRRGAKAFKAYLCLFVCFATKAVHVELATDLSTDQFILAFKRFLARRGRCADIYSDCGTNFVGARRYMNELRRFIDSPEFNKKMREFCLDQIVTWHFHPPTAPHMGGIWEAGIKSVKRHLLRVIGAQILTYEEFNTVLTQVEAMLNSRPLVPISSDPADVTALTPGHFLVGEPIVTMPELVDSQLEMPMLRRWHLLQATILRFWKCWSRDYLHTLQQRSKWLDVTPNPAEGTLVLVKEDNIPPMRWKLARIVKVIAGKDHISRVAEVRTTSGTMLRPLIKLCPLPISDQ